MPSAVDAREIRRAIRSAAIGGGASPERAEDLTLAAWEAVINAVEHGHGRPEVTIGVACDQVTVLVTEPVVVGSGGAPGVRDEPRVADPWAHRGRGRPIIAALTDEVRSFDGPGATYVELTIRLPG